MNQGENHWNLYKQLMDPSQVNNNEHRKMFLQKLMEMMRRRHMQQPQPQHPINMDRPTYSDTPGYGNQAPWQMPGLGSMPKQHGPQFDPPANAPMNQQRMLERMIMDKRLNDTKVWNTFRNSAPLEM